MTNKKRLVSLLLCTLQLVCMLCPAYAESMDGELPPLLALLNHFNGGQRIVTDVYVTGNADAAANSAIANLLMTVLDGMELKSSHTGKQKSAELVFEGKPVVDLKAAFEEDALIVSGDWMNGKALRLPREEILSAMKSRLNVDQLSGLLDGSNFRETTDYIAQNMPELSQNTDIEWDEEFDDPAFEIRMDLSSEYLEGLADAIARDLENIPANDVVNGEQIRDAAEKVRNFLTYWEDGIRLSLYGNEDGDIVAADIAASARVIFHAEEKTADLCLSVRTFESDGNPCWSVFVKGLNHETGKGYLADLTYYNEEDEKKVVAELERVSGKETWPLLSAYCTFEGTLDAEGLKGELHGDISASRAFLKSGSTAKKDNVPFYRFHSYEDWTADMDSLYGTRVLSLYVGNSEDSFLDIYEMAETAVDPEEPLDYEVTVDVLKLSQEDRDSLMGEFISQLFSQVQEPMSTILGRLQNAASK